MRPDTLPERLRAHPRPVVLDVWAPWCAPCRMIAPALDRLAAAHAGRVDLWKVNSDEEPDVARVLGVLGIPTVIAFRDGLEVGRRVGVQPEATLAALFAAAESGHAAANGPTATDRALRLGTAVLLVALATIADGSPVLIGAAVLAVLGAVYDRCPAWGAIARRVRERRVGSGAPPRDGPPR